MTTLKKRCASVLSLTLITSMTTVLLAAEPVYADPECKPAYVLFVRGATANLGSNPAIAFKEHVANRFATESGNNWAELGNLDKSVIDNDTRGPDTPIYEYPAAWADVWNNYHDYNNSVEIGIDELVTHLNDRYAGDGPRNIGRCQNETLVISAYSEGVEVVRRALLRGDLSPVVWLHIGFVALYGDPKRKACGPDVWWSRGNGSCSDGVMGAQIPYLHPSFNGRAGSWCDSNDGYCNGNWNLGSHGSIYQEQWIQESASEIVRIASAKVQYFNALHINRRLVGDVNGDGKSDAVVMFADTGTAKVALSTGGSFGYPGDWSYGHSKYATDYLLGDVTGDGKADLVAYYAYVNRWYVSVSSGSRFYNPTEWSYDMLRPDRIFLKDANGDGRADRIMEVNGTWYVSTSSGSGFWSAQLWISGHGVGSNDQQVGDFNGDGKADAAVWFASNGKWHVALSTGSSFGYPSEWSAGHGQGSNFRLIEDTTGDGKADIAYYTSSLYKWHIGASSGSGFWAPTEWSYDGPGFAGSDNDFLADVNGDGQADKVRWYRNSGDWYVGTSSGSGFWPMSRWIAGHGAGS